ncbi:hypothetical protein B7494_g7072 [Chlorociboria aeruginascens]|nr:hypothetical protein B7494_g7072 [Chlorociboria aeruginascens]
MESQKAATTQKRHKKRKSRTQDFSDSDDDRADQQVNNRPEEGDHTIDPRSSAKENNNMSDAEISAAFQQSYVQRATREFADDLDLVRGASDFKEDALALLIEALKQGTSGFSIEEQRRVVVAAGEKDRDLDRDGR